MPSAMPHQIVRLAHYHQAPGRQPGSRKIEAGTELVELVTGGRGWLEHGDRWVEVTPGALLWHCRGEGTIGRSDVTDPYRCLAVTFRVAKNARRRVSRITRWPDLDEVNRFTRDAVRRFLDERFPSEILLAWVYGQLVYHARIGKETSTVPDRSAARLERVTGLIETEYGTDLRLPDLALAADCSVPHLHHLFREHFGESPHQYLLRRRLLAARERLTATDQPIKQIALECGFGSPSAFCNAFQSRIGSTPSVYRAEQWQV